MESSFFPEVVKFFTEIGQDFYRRGWVLGTSGNFSAVLSRNPLRLAITASGLDKGRLTAGGIIQIDEGGKAIEAEAQPSAEAMLHLTIVGSLKANAVLHTHSIWNTIVSEAHASDGGLNIEGYEMLKGLAGVRTHEHCEWVPVIDNSQDYDQLARSVAGVLHRSPALHGFLLVRHGLYAWGEDLAEAKRHVEILEFLFEVIGRQHSAAG